MIDSITRITLNLQETNTIESIKAKRGDTGRKLLIHLSDGSIPYHISDDCYATFTANKPDGTKINNACTIENNVIEYEFTEQTCAAVGTMKAEIRLYGADRKLITSACFLINVYDTVFRDGDEISSEEEMNALNALISDANELITDVRQKLQNGEFIGPAGPQGPKGDDGNMTFEDLTEEQRESLRGPAGEAGPQGPQGETGSQGPQGETGPQGPQGERGPKGADGTGVTILGSFDTLEELNATYPTGNVGESYLISGYLYVWSAITAAWENVGNIQGPEGPQGPQGEKGEKGEKGDTGATGPVGPQGEKGEQGAQGDTGKTAYEYAKDGGYTGTEEMFAQKLAAEYLSTGGGTMEGEINMNGQPISGLSAPTEETQAARKGYVDAAVRKAAPRNLLDNSDFRNPVNQRGYESGAGVSDYDYFLDRWKHGIAEKTNYTLSSAGLGIPSGTYIVQVNETIRSGTYTFAVKQSDGSITILNCVVSFAADGSWKRCGTISADGMGLHVDTENGHVVYLIQSYKDVVVEWAAFYEGSYTADTLPPYVPKGYGAELAECRRYYQCYDEVACANIDATYPILGLTFPPMRVTPTLTIGSLVAGDNLVIDGIYVDGASVFKTAVTTLAIGGATGGLVYKARNVALSADL